MPRGRRVWRNGSIQADGGESGGMRPTRLLWSAYLAWHLIGQARVPFLPPAAIQQAQQRRLRRMVAHAYRSVPYYRETMRRLGLRPDDFRVVNDLARLPLLEREPFQRDPEYFVSTAQPLDRYLRFHTGGSSGAPLTVYHDPASMFQNLAHSERERSIYSALLGRSFGQRQMIVAASFGALHAMMRFCHTQAFFPPRLRASQRLISPFERMEEALRTIDEFQPQILYAFGSFLELLVTYLDEHGATMRPPRIVSYGGDMLADWVREELERRYRIAVFSTYQATEALKIGFECERHQGLHVNVDLYPLRIVDESGAPLSPGASGEVVVSNLVNRATVLLNYRLGDRAALGTALCACGRGLPLLKHLEGRRDDFVVLPSGRRIHPQALRKCIPHRQGIWQYQIEQPAADRLRVLLVTADWSDREEIARRTVAEMTPELDHQTTVEVAFIESIERTPSGKFRVVRAVQPTEPTAEPVAAGRR